MKIVTIDTDLIMRPCIELYNDEVGTDDPVSEYLKDFPYLKNSLPADFYIYEYLTRYIIMCCANGVSIKFIENHDEIVPIIKENFKEEKIDLINIDHHHDVSYDEDDDIILSPGVGDWVKYLKDRKMIKTYEWINNPNSYINEECLEYIDKITEFKDSHLENLSKETDLLVICESPSWIPEIYQPMFMIWQTIVEEMNNRGGEKITD